MDNFTPFSVDCVIPSVFYAIKEFATDCGWRFSEFKGDRYLLFSEDGHFDSAEPMIPSSFTLIFMPYAIERIKSGPPKPDPRPEPPSRGRMRTTAEERDYCKRAWEFFTVRHPRFVVDVLLDFAALKESNDSLRARLKKADEVIYLALEILQRYWQDKMSNTKTEDLPKHALIGQKEQ